MRRDVVVAEPAERQLRIIDDWWRHNRPAAIELFEQEFAAAVATLVTHPASARAYDADA